MIFVILLLIISFGMLLYILLDRKIKAIKNLKDNLDNALDERFKIYEGLIEQVSNHVDYEQTILMDIVQFRVQAQGAKMKSNEKIQFINENRISKLSNKINLFFDEYPILEKMDNINELKEKIVLSEKNLNISKKEYNEAVINYESLSNKFPFNVILMIVSKLDNKLEVWK